MLLTLTTTHAPATDLGYLLHKHPDRCQSFNLAFGKAHVFYPEAGEHRCTAALLLDVDPVGMVRNRRGPAGEGFHLRQYVNDRPFVASSLMSVAIARVFGSALSGRCEQRSELVEQPIPLTAKLSVVPCRGGDGLLRRLFEPLGYRVNATRHPLDEKFPEWGESSYYTVELSAECRLQDLLAQLYVLIPVLDDDKHDWGSRDDRLASFDAATVVEVIEHLDAPRLAAFERVVFECAKPRTVIVTTPNIEYNVRFETLPAGKFRHKDHRFEWPRAEFQEWANAVAERFGYAVRFAPVGPVDSEVGLPTQMGVFDREAER